jgi:transcriptional regulator with XRE-family HTH domain
MAKLMTIPDLAAKAGIGARTLSNIERGSVVGRPESLRSIAGALGVSPESLQAASEAPPAPAASPEPPPPKPSSPTLDLPRAKVPPRTRLDALADLVRARGLSRDPVVVGKAKLPVLDPVAMQNLFARHAAFEGESFVVEGKVDRQRALAVAEARALKTKVGVGARYRIVVDVVGKETLDVTVHAVDARVAAALQEKMGQGARVVVTVRVAAKNDARVVSLFASARKRAWALVAGRVL